MRPKAPTPLAVYVLIKAIICSFYAGSVCIVPFLPIYFKDVGMSPYLIGVLGGLRPFLNAVGAPIFGALADATRARRLVLLATLAISVPCRVLIVFSTSAAALCLLTAISESVGAAPGPLIDAAAIDAIQAGEYGAQRLWGSIGWGGVAIAAGYVFEHFGVRTVVVGHVVLSAAAGGLILFLRPQPETGGGGGGPPVGGEMKPAGGQRLSQSPNVDPCPDATGNAAANATVSSPGQLLRTVVLGSRAAAAFWAAHLLAGAALGLIGTFSFLLFASLGVGATWLGLVLTVNCCAEVPCFLASPKLMAVPRLGPVGVLMLGLAAGVIRCGYYVLLASVIRPGGLGGGWGSLAVLAAEPLHGLQFAAYWAASVAVATGLSPDPAATTSIMGLQGGVWAAGLGAGSLIGGPLYANWGAPGLFGATSLGLLTALVILGTAGGGGQGGGAYVRVGAERDSDDDNTETDTGNGGGVEGGEGGECWRRLGGAARRTPRPECGVEAERLRGEGV